MTTSLEAMEMARKALKAFRAIQPALTTYARVLTGKPDVRVVASSDDNGSTDGTRIFFRPPLALGRDTGHVRWQCDQRNENGVLICPACANREQVLSVIYHEIAHIWKDSFADVNDRRRREAIQHAIDEVGGKYAEKIRERIDKASWVYAHSSYLALASFISPYLKLVVNALEDARINMELFRAYPGAVPMFDAKMWRIFEEGVEQVDHITGQNISKPWREYPMNMQAICALFCMASGYDFSKWFHEDVVEALNDEKLRELVGQINTLTTVEEVYVQSFPVLARLRELGFCKREEDPEDEEPPPPPPPDAPSSPDDEAESEEKPDEGDNDHEPTPDDSGEQGEQDGNTEEPGETEESGTSPGEPDDEGNEAQDAGDGSESASSGPGEDQQGTDDAPGGDESGESGTGDGTDEEASPESGDEPEPGDAGGETGEVGDGDSNDEAQGSAGTGSEAEGSSGGEVVDDELDPGEGDTGADDGGADPAGNQDLDQDVPGSGETGSGGSEVQAGDDPGLGGSAVGDPSGDGADVPDAGNEDDDLGGSEGVDTPDGQPSGTESAGVPGVRPEEGGRDDGSSDDNLVAEDQTDPGAADDELDESDDGDPLGPPPEYTHGTKLNLVDEPDSGPKPEMGTPDDVEKGLGILLDHEPPLELDSNGNVIDPEEAMDAAIVQGMYFETPSATIIGVNEYEFPEEMYERRPWSLPGVSSSTGFAWAQGEKVMERWERRERGIDGDFSVAEATIAPSLLKARIVFGANLRGASVTGLKSGKVSSRHLGRRVPVDDPRIMRRSIRPQKRSYFVLIGIDVSGSTQGPNLVLAKQLAMAEAELLSRLRGVDFAVIAHGGHFVRSVRSIAINYYHVKRPGQPWDDRARMRLERLGADSINLDGHSMEFYRKILDKQTATDRILHYYTDGAMPAANFDEELEVLQREIKICRQKGYHLRGIGIRTDSPTEHGLKTIELNEQSDILLVIKDLEQQLMGR